MGMEGINWDEVNAEAAKIRTSLQDFSEDVASKTNEFAAELSNYWASGNALTCEKELSSALRDIALEITSGFDDLANLIIHAAKIYSSTFNVPCDIYTGNIIYSSLTSEVTPVFKKVNNGITGMNKNEATTCVDQFKNAINGLIESIKTQLGNIHISVLDNANIQKEAFDQKIQIILKDISNKVENTLRTVEKSKNTEIDRLELAKNQTTSTFSA